MPQDVNSLVMECNAKQNPSFQQVNGTKLECSGKPDIYLPRRMAIEEARESAERLKVDFLEQMEEKLSAVINDVVHTMQKVETVDGYKSTASPSSFSSNTFRSLSAPSAITKEDTSSLHMKSAAARPSRKLSVSGKLPEKVFVFRPSPLTELLQVTHFKTIHHIFIATLILIMLHNIILDLVERNTVDLGLMRLMWAFGNTQMTLGILLGLEFCGLVVLYPAFHFWAKLRRQVKPEWTKVIDYSGGTSFLLFLTGMIYVPAALMWNNPLPPASGATVTMEQCRLLMKIYAFVRSNAPRVVATGESNDDNGNNESKSGRPSKKSRRRSSTSSNGSAENSVTSTVSTPKQKNDDDDEDLLKVGSLNKSPLASSAEPNNSWNQDADEICNDEIGTCTMEEATTTIKHKTSTDFSACFSPQSEVRKRRNGEKSFDCDQAADSNDDDRKVSMGRKTLLNLSVPSARRNSDNGGAPGFCPSYSKYLYFYVAPTLIYKDNYPRTSFVRWDYVFWNFAQVFGCIVYANFILSRYSTFYFENFGHPNHPMTVLQFCNAVFSMMIPGILGLVLGFYLLLHSWHNAFAEMLCFGDRLFYKDWWNCSSFHSYYKTWNILVHDWLYTYIFKDAWEMGLARYHKAIPTILVFLISSLFHEYVLSFTFNFFFPVLLTLFGGFGLALTFLRYSDSAVGNIFMWSGLISGSGILVSTYTMEFYARINCPGVQENSTADFFTPRFWTCNAIVWS